MNKIKLFFFLMFFCNKKLKSFEAYLNAQSKFIQKFPTAIKSMTHLWSLKHWSCKYFFSDSYKISIFLWISIKYCSVEQGESFYFTIGVIKIYFHSWLKCFIFVLSRKIDSVAKKSRKLVSRQVDRNHFSSKKFHLLEKVFFFLKIVLLLL